MTPESEHTCENQPAGFGGLGLAPKLLDIIEKEGFVCPTPIQHKAIPAAVAGEDVIGIAQTGTGKTLAFGLPMLQRLAIHKGKGLVVLPTRELALQVEENLQRIGKALGLRTAVLIGGTSMEPQKRALAADPHVIIVTPGRLIDHIEHRTVNLSRVSILILDEADRMLDMGFKPQINRILKSVPKERQTMLFSATMPDDIVRIATEHMKRPVRIEVAPPGTTAEHVEHELFVVNKDQKNRLLEALLVEYHGSILVFTRTRFAARRVARAAQRMGHTAADIHSDRTLAQRREALEGFKTGKYRVLVATDIASRGIDVNGIEVVINYDIPEKADDYVHRIGRTGRAGMSGKAISFATPDQGDEIEAIEHLASVHLPVSRLPALPPDRPRPEGDDDRRGGRQGGGFVRRDGRGGGGFGGSRGRDGGRRPPAGRQGDRRRGSSFSGSSSGGKRSPSGFGSSQPAVGQKPSGGQSGRTATRPGQARNDDSSQGGRHRGSDRSRPEQGQGGNRRGPQISDDLLGLSLWPDTPNLHGGLNRKPLDDKHRR